MATTALGLGLALIAPSTALASATASAPSAASRADDAPTSVAPGEPTPNAVSLELSVPRRQVVMGGGSRVYSDLGARLIAHGASFQLNAIRTSYSKPVTASVDQGGHVRTLPVGSMKTLSGLDRFIRLRVQPINAQGKPAGKAYGIARDVCLGAVTERTEPDAAPTSPYPQVCQYNPYSLGGVMGIQEGWASSMIDPYGSLLMRPGRYDVEVSLRPVVARALGVKGPTSARTRVVVESYEEEPHGGGGHHAVGRATVSPDAPSTSGPRGRRLTPSEGGPAPDLRSLPAWGIQLSPSGKYLQFSATVWNAGDSPLVVDGFRRPGKDLMDGYQYFFDAEGNQVGYQPVGTFEWDSKDTHLHWHFRDFATYTLLRADKSRIVKSRKEAFCLANTDAVDLTVRGATWEAYNEDLSTACGDYSSRSIREVLLSGWGDTYAQFRAGQSFKIADLPNGAYYIEVAANPSRNLVESDESNNDSLRKIWLGGTPGKRTLRVAKVGIVSEPAQDRFEGGR
ncbi:lysyl oxidase family protein [Nocardioides sp. R-C-SC26]|uniref:lysyl oxidase family protein n=1 Tax=Nocardioides sp. R-C-SC26 TaxID=2870414 RepID=UPI001E6013B5|nr:lysyl oxidase family protein [Nocardioides sp. R-C-SC26]